MRQRVERREHDRWLEGLCVAGVALVSAFYMLGPFADVTWRSFPLDDAFIHLVYARNLGRHGMLAYNPGVPEAGASSLLWIIVTALPAALLRWPAVVPAIKLLCASFAGVTALGVAEITRELGGTRAERLIAASCVLFGPAYSFAAVSGMEVSLTSALLAWAIVGTLRRQHRAAGWLLGLAGLARPESGLVTIVLVLLERKRGWRAVAALSTASLVLGACWLGYSYAITGHMFPNTFYAKAHTPSLTGLEYLWRQLLLNHGPVFAAALATCSGVGLWRLRGEAGLLHALAPLAPMAVIACTYLLDPGVDFYMRRYFLPFSPFAAPLLACGLLTIARRLSARGALPLSAAMLTLLFGPALVEERARYIAHCRDVELLHIRPARELIARLPAHDVVAVEGAGASRYFGGHTIVDLVGLNDHELVHVHGPRRPCVLMSRHPSVFVVPSDFVDPLGRYFELTPLYGYRVAHWSVYQGKLPHTVVAARATPRPTQQAACEQQLARSRVRTRP